MLSSQRTHFIVNGLELLRTCLMLGTRNQRLAAAAEKDRVAKAAESAAAAETQRLKSVYDAARAADATRAAALRSRRVALAKERAEAASAVRALQDAALSKSAAGAADAAA